MTASLFFSSCAEDGGIYHYVLQNGKLTLCSFTSCDRPMYTITEEKHLWVLLRDCFDDHTSGLQEYEILDSGVLMPIGELISTKGIVACHLCRFHEKIYAANYLSGSIFSSDGVLDVHTGHGAHPGRQEAPHTHFIAPSPDRKFLLSTDLGLDSIFVYDEGLNVRSIAHVPAGQGVRHLAYADDGMTIFAANELGSAVSMFTYHDGQMTLRQTIPVLIHECENMPAAIRVRGEYVYVSNRGDDSISCLHWDQSGMELCSVTPCGGCWPRDFEIIENTIFCTNEKSNTVTVLSVDSTKIKDTGERIAMKAPICVTVN